MKLIYIACPYADPSPLVRLARVRLASLVACEYACQGHGVFSPLSHSIEIGKFSATLAHNAEYWYELDLKLLEACDEIVVIQVPNWGESVGVATEIDRAKELNIPVTYLTPEEINKWKS